MKIRFASPTDSKEVMPIIVDTIGSIAHHLAGVSSAEDALDILTMLFPQPNHRLSYQNCRVLELDGKIVGVCVAYHGSESSRLDELYITRIQQITGRAYSIAQEAQPDEFYIDTIGLLPEYRGKGYGSLLMADAENIACQCGYNKMGLLVSHTNKGAYQLYCRLGYEVDGELYIAPYNFLHLSKYIL